MRCPRCGNEVDLQTMECDRCGLATPKSKSDSTKEGKGNTGRLTGQLKPKKTTFNWLPSFLANSPLNKIKIPPILVVLLVLIIPSFAVGYYFYVSGGCIQCTEVGGTYTGEITIDEQPIKLDLLLFQYGSIVTGQIQFSTKPDPTSKPPVKKDIYVEYIDTISINDKGVLFKTKLKGNLPRVEFSGNIANNSLTGNIVVTIPELNCNGKTFAITIKKS